jgi:hypothetical protein
MRFFAVALAAALVLAPGFAEAASPAPLSGNQAVVDAAYRVLLGRPADLPALNAFGAALTSGQLNRMGLVTTIVASQEFRTAEVGALYQQFLNRPADGGAQAFVTLLAQGATVQQVAAQVLGSPEYFAGRGGGNNDGFVAALYNDVLGRKSDPPAALFATQLTGGTSRAAVALEILQSLEGNNAFQTKLNQRLLHGSGAPAGAPLVQAALAEIDAMLLSPAAVLPSRVKLSNVPPTPESYVAAAYSVILGRPPDKATLATLAAQMSGGMNSHQLVQYLESSLEFRQIEIQFFYKTFLGRPADSQGLGAFANLLANGGKPEAIVAALVSTQEYFEKRGNTSVANYVERAYLDVLGRAPTKNELADWTKALAGGTTRAQFANAIVTDGTSRLQGELVPAVLHGAGAKPGDSLLQAAIDEIDNALR